MPLSQDTLDRLFGEEHDAEPAEPKRGEAIFAGTDYPHDWAGFIGQDEAIEQLRVHVASALARGVRLDHTLLESGLHGVGKTTLATLMAYQAGKGFLQTSGPLSVTKARQLMSGMQDHDVLFVDEAHTLVGGNKNKADWLLPFMTEGVLLTERGAEKMPDITLIAATTEAGKLPTTLVSRFMLTPALVPYTPTQGAQIACNLAQRMNVPVDPATCVPITMAADHNPRAMRKILTKVRDLSYAYPETHPNLERAFRWAGVSEDGLATTAREVLVLLLTSHDFTCSIDSIRAHLGEPGPIKHHEQALLQRGLVTVTGRGRKLTDAGIARARQEVATLRSSR